MLKIISISLFLLSFCFTVFSQTAPDTDKIEKLKKADAEVAALENQVQAAVEKRDALRRELTSVEDADEAEARKIYARAVKLFPDGVLDELIPLPDGESFSIYPFIEIDDFYDAPRLVYTNGMLKFKPGKSGGFIYNLGGTPIETVNDKSREFAALTKFKSPESAGEIPNNFKADQFEFGNSTPAIAGNTYLLRTFNTLGKDGIYVMHIKRKYADGSIILFVKLLKNFSFSNASVKPSQAQRPLESVVPKRDYEKIELKQKIEAALIAKGFTEITIDATTIPFTLRGTFPKDKLAEIMQTAMEVNGGKPIKNEATGK